MTGERRASNSAGQSRGRDSRHARGLARRCGKVSGTEAEDLQAQVVVFLCLADPFHADTADHCHGARVGWPNDRDDLLYALLECPPRQCQPGLGGVAVTPCIRVKLPADLELLVRRQRQQGWPADQTPFLAKLDRPAAGRSEEHTSEL